MTLLMQSTLSHWCSKTRPLEMFAAENSDFFILLKLQID